MAVANMFERIIHGDSRVKDDGERKYPSDLDLSKTRTSIPRVNNSVQQKTGANRGVSYASVLSSKIDPLGGSSSIMEICKVVVCTRTDFLDEWAQIEEELC
ncbi:hypothetical protein LOK49_LG13G00049 [Camellia lanceoleosa]|uniref:Uncharacterized protein n=1 Tax=Camellia lanceoleosa TaxID=1840588 RepID=A0ACC0FI68_9ERIC|nr:hypothetical protein LOK49_LG13G00049 [Camellia lanceoleosa]